ncbi:MAG: ABC transporter ATP-binding protein [Gammaproteobacteria bacterium]|nr:ABC transporter ATP-binding protein [Gammaproteobacteria bacterium]
MELLEVRNLITEFETDESKTRAVDGVSFSISEGMTLGIVGESGCGKSVTALSIMGLLPRPAGKILSGEIHFNEIDLAKSSAKEMEAIRGNRIGMIFQEPMTALNPVLTIGNQMIEAYRIHKDMSYDEALRSAISMLDRVGITSPDLKILQYPHQLSGGMRQRVMIAMAISCNPDLLIADEPTTALDVTVQAQILELIQELQKELGMSVLMITHDLGVVAETCDKVVVMYGGKVCETADVLDIFDHPAHPYTKGLLASIPHLESTPKSKLPVMTAFGREKNEIPDKSTILTTFVSDENNFSRTSYENQSIENNEIILRVENLKMYFPIRKGVLAKTKDYNKAVNGVSFCIKKGETLGLVGESGCGKSTLARCILRLYEPTSGKIIFKGTDTTKLKPSALKPIRNQIQMIFQDPMDSLNPRHTVGEIIGEPLAINKFSTSFTKKRVREILDIVGLPSDSADRYTFEFSGGQKQRIGIARALVLNPQLIVCDEAVSALDVSTQAQILNLLLDLQEEFNLTYLFISHNLAVVKHMSDEVAVMYLGKIVEENSSDRIYGHSEHPYTSAMISAIPANHPAKKAGI